VLDRMRAHLTYANVVSTLCLFVLLGGSAYAIARNSVGSREIRNNSVRSVDLRNNNVTSRDIRNRSLRGRDFRADSIGARQIRESTLRGVAGAERAKLADDAGRLAGLLPEQLRQQCPAGTGYQAGVCFELAVRPSLVWGNAVTACGAEKRRLPTFSELLAYATGTPAGGSDLAVSGELTGSVYEAGGALRALVMTNNTGGVTSVADTAGNERAYRCVVPPSDTGL
jgi:hypothetical protein